MNTVSSQKRKYELKARAEALERTRERIAAAAAELHEQVGVARTTVADIARRAGVQRLTVYNHFPDLETLLPACTAHYMTLHPLPDFGAAAELDEPPERLRKVLGDLYAWYRENEAIQARVQGERATVPELEEFMAGTMDVALGELGATLAAELDERARPMVGVALDFWTWRRLKGEGLDDAAAADLMTAAVAAYVSAA